MDKDKDVVDELADKDSLSGGADYVAEERGEQEISGCVECTEDETAQNEEDRSNEVDGCTVGIDQEANLKCDIYGCLESGETVVAGEPEEINELPFGQWLLGAISKIGATKKEDIDVKTFIKRNKFFVAMVSAMIIVIITLCSLTAVFCTKDALAYNLVLHQNAQLVQKNLGKPTSISETADGVTWYYYKGEMKKLAERANAIEKQMDKLDPIKDMDKMMKLLEKAAMLDMEISQMTGYSELIIEFKNPTKYVNDTTRSSDSEVELPPELQPGEDPKDEEVDLTQLTIVHILYDAKKDGAKKTHKLVQIDDRYWTAKAETTSMSVNIKYTDGSFIRGGVPCTVKETVDEDKEWVTFTVTISDGFGNEIDYQYKEKVGENIYG